MDSRAQVMEVKRKYDATSSGYDELYGREQLMKFEAIGDIIETSSDGRKVLDAGCGTGLILEFFKIRKTRPLYYVGIDVSYGMLRRLLGKLGGDLLDFQRVDLVRGDVIHLPFRENAFHTILSITVLNNIPEDRVKEVLYNMRRVATDTRIISLINVEETTEINRLLREKCGRLPAALLKEVFYSC